MMQKNCKNIEQFFEILFKKPIRDLITRYTNNNSKSSGHCSPKSEYFPNQRLTDSVEIDAFIGLHLCMGFWKANRVSGKDLWSNGEGDNVLRSTRDNATNRFSLIEEIWCVFIKNCTMYYNPVQITMFVHIVPSTNNF